MAIELSNHSGLPWTEVAIADYENAVVHDLRFNAMPPIEHKDFAGQKSLLKVIREKDILLVY